MPGSGGVAGPVDIRGRHALERPVRHFTREVEQCRERNVEGVADQDRLIDAHLSLMGDNLRKMLYGRPQSGCLSWIKARSPFTLMCLSFRILPTLSIATQVIEREGGEEVRIR